MRVLLDFWGNDVRQACRRIVRAPGLSAVVIVTLGLSIAANATIFSLLKPTVLRRLSAPQPDALISIGATDGKTGAYSAIHLTALRELKSQPSSIAILGAYVSSVVRVELDGNGVDVGAEGVTPEYFDVLGVRARAGRVLSGADDPLAPVAVITARLSARLFGTADPTGQTIVVDGQRVTVIGVTEEGFTGVRMDGGDEMFLPIGYLRGIQTGDFKSVPRAQQIIGRLSPGVSLDTARAEVLARWTAIQAVVAAEVPAQRDAILAQRLSVDSFARGFSGIRDRYGRSLGMVMGLALSLLAVGCVNLSGLMLARGMARQHEFAIRTSLGVTRARLFQQTLVDGLILSLLALAAAIPLSWWASRLLTSMVSVARVIPLGDTTPDLTVLAAAGAVSVIAGLAIGVLPARRAIAGRVDDVLRGRGTSHRIHGTARAVMITQIAVSMILVIGAGLFATTLANLYANDVTPRANPILFTRLARNPLERTTMLGQPYFQGMQTELQAIAGADAAAFSNLYPAYMGFFTGLPLDTVSAGEGRQAQALADLVSPGFFELYSIARLRGRDFTWADDEASPRVAIVNETLARRLFDSFDVVGRRVELAAGPVKTELEIVGVVADATVGSIRDRNVPGLYRPLLQDVRRAQNPMAHVRVTGSTADVQRGYVEVINRQGRHLVRALFTMDEWIDNAVVEQQLIAGMAGVAATLAIALASVGLFGLLAYSVSSRVREIGIRVSVGATRGEVVRMIVREGLTVAIPGVVIGIPVALAAAWLIRSQLYGVSPVDPWTIAGAALLFAITAALASWLPARRAARIEPADALRQD